MRETKETREEEKNKGREGMKENWTWEKGEERRRTKMRKKSRIWKR